MTTERWDQVKRLFEAAVRAAGPEHREAVLAVLDADLRKEVESLLAAEGDSFLDQTPPVVHPVAPETAEKSTGIRPPSAETKTPDRIGPCRMLHLLEMETNFGPGNLPLG